MENRDENRNVYSGEQIVFDAIPSEFTDEQEETEARPGKVRRAKAPRTKKPPVKLPPWLTVILFAVTLAVIVVGMAVFLAKNAQSDFQIVGAAFAMLVSFGVFVVYVMLRKKPCVTNVRQVALVCVCMLAAIIPLYFSMRINVGFAPFMFAVLLIALMLSERVAIFSALPIGTAAGIIAEVNGVGDAVPFAVMLAVIVSTIAAVLSISIGKTRSSTVIAAAVGGAAGVVAYAGVMLLTGELFMNYWQPLLWIIGSSLISGVLAVGIMPVFESAFDIASDARLNELLNSNNPLLKRLMTETPGTYHHSLIVAALAEAAAERIGANALLCRVCASYHDVGKLKAPLYFKENQHGRNIHDELDPYESARTIIAHVADGVALLEKYKLPGEVIRIVSQHHGDSVMVYFYDKAKKQAPEGTIVDETLFRYPSSKPSSKEAALLLLADCCEAAVRSMTNPSMNDIRARVRDVIGHKWDKRDSMLWDSPLTFVDIKKIEESFLNTFAALYHERIEYPDLGKVDVR